MRHAVRTIVVRSTLVLVLLLASCGGGGSDDNGSGTSSPDPAATDGASSSTPGSEGTTKKQRARVERPSGAPLGEVIPPGDDAYLLLSQGRCSELLGKTQTWRRGEDPVNEDAFFLYRAAANACLERWDDALRDYERLQKLAPRFSGGCESTNCERCMRAVKRWLDDVLATHGRARDDVEYVKGTKSSPCPEGVGDPDDETTTTADATTTSRSRTSTTGAASTTRL